MEPVTSSDHEYQPVMAASTFNLDIVIYGYLWLSMVIGCFNFQPSEEITYDIKVIWDQHVVGGATKSQQALLFHLS